MSSLVRYAYKIHIQHCLTVILVCAVGILVLIAVLSTRYAYSGTDEPRCRHAVSRAELLPSDAGTARGCHGHPAETLDLQALKTGDLLVIAYRDPRLIFIRLTTDSVWTHPGMIWIDPTTQEPFVLEMCGYRAPYNGHVLKVPLLHWIRLNRNAYSIAYVAINQPIANESVIQTLFTEFETKIDFGIEGLRWDWFRFYHPKTPETVRPTSLFAAPHRKVTPAPDILSANPWTYLPKTMREAMWTRAKTERRTYPITCCEFLVYVLQQAGVVDPRITPCSYLPESLANGKLPTVNGYSYAESVPVSVLPLVDIGKIA